MNYPLMEWGDGAALGFGCRLTQLSLKVDILVVITPIRAGWKTVTLTKRDGASTRVRVYFEDTRDIGYANATLPRVLPEKRRAK